jgi:hypothetical protein
MIYPKKVQEWILGERPANGEFAKYLFADTINKTRNELYVEDFTLDIWLKREGKGASDDIAEYFSFITEIYERFKIINRGLGYINDASTHTSGHDRWATGWAGPGLMPIALYLYYLHSFGIRGKVLECGTFKGGSTCCLSWVCDTLGMELIVADSFAGLPGSEGHYGEGDFLGSLEEVQENVSRHGKIGCVEFVKGLYSESLGQVKDDLSLIWLDVDLQQSVLDALGKVFPRLLPNGVIFSDGLVDVVDYQGDSIRMTGGEPAGLNRFFAENKIPYKAKPGGPRGLCLIVPNCAEDEQIIYQARKHDILVFN